MSTVQLINISLEEFQAKMEMFVRAIVIDEQRTNTQHGMSPEKYLTRKDVARILQIDLSTVNNWKKSGKLKAYQIGGRVFFKSSELPLSLQAIRPNLL